LLPGEASKQRRFSLRVFGDGSNQQSAAALRQMNRDTAAIGDVLSPTGAKIEKSGS
jgi:hypothetical protein